MKDKTKIYVDLSKCSEEQIKAIPQILEKACEKLSNNFKNGIKNNFEYLKFRFDNGINAWCVSGFKGVRTELTYPEFIKLFEGGKEEKEIENIKDIAHTEGVLVGLKICKELWAQGTISHESIQEEIYHYQEELDNLNSK